MSDIYIAKQSVGQYRLGEVIDGLTDDRIKFLLAENAIELIESDADADAEVVKLDKLTKAELTTLLDEEGIDYNDSDTKAELIALFPKD